MSDKTYNIISALSSQILPALAFFLATLSTILNLSWLAIAAAIVSAAAAALGKIRKEESDKFFSDKEIITKEVLEEIQNGSN